jgi:ribosomal protein S12 methylthiotransferase
VSAPTHSLGLPSPAQTSHEEADAIVVNTCAFVDDAKAESISAILDAAGYKQAGKAKRVVVTGCLAQRYAADLASELPEVDLVVGFQEYPKLSAELHSALGPQRPRAAEEQPGGSAGK